MSESDDENDTFSDIDCCFQCGNDDFVVDHHSFDRICTNCGICSSAFLEEILPHNMTQKQRKYHFANVLKKSFTFNAPIDANLILSMEHMFKEVEDMFYMTQNEHKRKYMINYPFVIHKILEKLNRKDLLPFVKMTKAPKTLLKLEDLWDIIMRDSHHIHFNEQ